MSEVCLEGSALFKEACLSTTTVALLLLRRDSRCTAVGRRVRHATIVDYQFTIKCRVHGRIGDVRVRPSLFLTLEKNLGMSWLNVDQQPARVK